MNSIIVSGEGFLKECTYIQVEPKEPHKFCPIWTKKLWEAKLFNGSSANKFIESHDLTAFVWKPKEETPIRDRYEIIKERDYDIMNEKDNPSPIWVVRKVTMKSYSDIKFLSNNLEIPKDDYYDLDDAVRICRNKNIEMIENLQNKVMVYNDFEK